MEQIKNNLPEDTYKCRLDTLNILVCLFNVVVPAIVWLFIALGMLKAAVITYDISYASLVMSCIALIWGIHRMARFYEIKNDMLPNKAIIVMHIFSYLFIIIANPIQVMTASNAKAYEISSICLIVVYFVCNLIFGLIVNTIVAKIEKATNFIESTSSSLIESATLSFTGSE